MDKKAHIWFFTDIHGSNACFRKFLNTYNNANKPNCLIIGADITGKQIIPIVENDNEVFKVPLNGKEVLIRKENLEDIVKKLGDAGYYTWECSDQQFKQFSLDEDGEFKKSVFNKLVKERLEEWVKLADEKLPSPDECKVLINAGNDDPLFIDAILDKSSKMIRGEGKVIEIAAGIKILSTGCSIPTPWNCPRDVSEEEMGKRIAQMMNQVNAKDDQLIFNFHCPPRNTSLDLANKINLKTKRLQAGLGTAPTINAGSLAVREAIEAWQPIAGLHGHIHEVHAKEKIGRTICYNPGTDYQNGRLQGVFLKVNKHGTIEYETLTMEREPGTDGDNRVLDTVISMVPILGTIYQNYKNSQHQSQVAEDLKSLKKEYSEIKKLLNHPKP